MPYVAPARLYKIVEIFCTKLSRRRVEVGLVNFLQYGTHPLLDNGRKSMKRTFAFILAALASVALFVGLV